jgi:uncharacterized protein YhaN
VVVPNAEPLRRKRKIVRQVPRPVTPLHVKSGAGTAQRTNGAPTKTNLYKVAQVSRAAMNRAVEIIAEWDEHLSRRDGRTPEQAHRDEELDEPAKKLKDAQAERANLRREARRRHRDRRALPRQSGTTRTPEQQNRHDRQPRGPACREQPAPQSNHRALLS